jgi:hypothetical protein
LDYSGTVKPLRVVERWVLSATPGQPKEEKKYHGTVRDMISASSHVLSSISRGRYPIGIWQ